MKSKTEKERPKTSAQAAERRKLIVLGVLLLLIVLANAAQWTRIVPPSPRPEVKSETSQKRQPPVKKAVEGDPGLDFPLADPPQFAEEKRNIFSFFVPPPPPPDPETIRRMEEERRKAAELAANPLQPVCGNNICEPGENYQTCSGDCPPPPPPPPPPIELKYIGLLREADGDTAFLTDGKEIFLGRVNDVIANKYRVVKITDDGVELAYLYHQTNQTKTIPFEGMNKS